MCGTLRNYAFPQSIVASHKCRYMDNDKFDLVDNTTLMWTMVRTSGKAT